MKIGIVWFKTNLRLNDNPVLAEALRQCDVVIPIYIIPNRWFFKQFGIPKIGVFRMRFILESLADLQQELQKKGNNLLVFKGEAHEIISELIEKYQVEKVFVQKELTAEEQFENRQVTKVIPTVELWDNFLIEPQALPFPARKTPDIFTAFRKQVERNTSVRKLIPTPEKIPAPELEFPAESTTLPPLTDFFDDIPPLDKRSAFPFSGGSTSAHQRLQDYIWDKQFLRSYKNTRNQLLGTHYSSKFSAWLAQGCISPVEIYHQVERFEKEVIENDSTYWLIFELLWRDFFRYVTLKYGSKIFHLGGIKNLKIKGRQNFLEFRFWADGQTKDRFINANMKELAKTGFMSNRGRQNVASYLVKISRLDWRMGAAWFEYLLTDYDPCSNYGNWMYVAGVGNDPLENRFFHSRKQAQYYDPNGEYTNLWLK